MSVHIPLGFELWILFVMPSLKSFGVWQQTIVLRGVILIEKKLVWYFWLKSLGHEANDDNHCAKFISKKFSWLTGKRTTWKTDRAVENVYEIRSSGKPGQEQHQQITIWVLVIWFSQNKAFSCKSSTIPFFSFANVLELVALASRPRQVAARQPKIHRPILNLTRRFNKRGLLRRFD